MTGVVIHPYVLCQPKADMAPGFPPEINLDCKAVAPDFPPDSPRPSTPPEQTRPSVWRASAWAGCREFMAQAAGAAIGLLVRSRLSSASSPVLIACGVGAAVVMAWMVCRSAHLAQAASGMQTPENSARRLASRLVMVAIPTAAVVSATVSTARSGSLAATTAFLAGKLTQRCVRYAISTSLIDLGPAIDFFKGDGVAIHSQERLLADWHRAVVMVLPTLALCLTQEYAAPSPAADAIDPASEQALSYVLAVALVEAIRALGGTWALASDARAKGWTMQHRTACASRGLRARISLGTTFRDARDAAAMRQVMGITADWVSVMTDRPTDSLRRFIFCTLRSELKSLGEFRGPLVRQGQWALAQKAPGSVQSPQDEPRMPPAFLEPVPMTAMLV